MSWEEEVEGLRARRELAKAHGGAEAVDKQHARGRLTVRERVDALLDEGSFREHAGVTGTGEEDDQGQLKSFEPSNVVAGIGRLEGRPVVVCGDDFTVAGATYSPAGMKKGVYADELATTRRMPMVRLLEGGGARISGLQAKGRSGYDLTQPSIANVAMLRTLQEVPVVCAALGPVAGFPAARLVTSHLSVMTQNTAQVLIGGPALVERATGEKLTKEETRRAPSRLCVAALSTTSRRTRTKSGRSCVGSWPSCPAMSESRHRPLRTATRPSAARNP